MPSIRSIITVAVPAVTALLGLIWYFGRKKPVNRDPPDKSIQQQVRDSSLARGKSAAESPDSNKEIGQSAEHQDVPSDSGDARTSREFVVNESITASVSNSVSCSQSAVNNADSGSVPVEETFVSSAAGQVQTKVPDSTASPVAAQSTAIKTTVEKPVSSSVPIEDAILPISANNVQAFNTEQTLSQKSSSSDANQVQCDELKTFLAAIETSNKNAGASNGQEPQSMQDSSSAAMSHAWHEDVPDVNDSNDLPVNQPCESEISAPSNLTQCAGEQIVNCVELKSDSDNEKIVQSPKSSKESVSDVKTVENGSHENSSNCDNSSEVCCTTNLLKNISAVKTFL